MLLPVVDHVLVDLVAEQHDVGVLHQRRQALQDSVGKYNERIINGLKNLQFSKPETN